MGEEFQVEEAELEGRMSWALPPASREEAEGCREWVGTGEGDSIAGRPPNPRRVPPPTDPLKAPVKYGVGGGGTT